jgi:hypothetical protein
MPLALKRIPESFGLPEDLAQEHFSTLNPNPLRYPDVKGRTYIKSHRWKLCSIAHQDQLAIPPVIHIADQVIKEPAAAEYIESNDWLEIIEASSTINRVFLCRFLSSTNLPVPSVDDLCLYIFYVWCMRYGCSRKTAPLLPFRWEPAEPHYSLMIQRPYQRPENELFSGTGIALLPARFLFLSV